MKEKDITNIDEELGQVSFNIGKLFHIRIYKILSYITESYISEDTEGYFKGLRELFINVAAMIQTDFSDDFAVLQKLIYKKEEIRDKLHPSRISGYVFTNREEAVEKLEKLRKKLYKEMYDRNLIISQKGDPGEAIEKIGF